MENHIADAVAKGASVIEGGARSDLGERFLTQTVLAGVTSDIIVACEETFGLVAPLFKFNSEAEVVALANNSEFGLTAYF